jgi:hypothetical protein
MQTELLDRRRWTTRIELANAIFEYLEIFHNRQRRHSALGWRTPLSTRSSTQPTSPDSHTPRSPNGAHITVELLHPGVDLGVVADRPDVGGATCVDPVELAVAGGAGVGLETRFRGR